MGSKIPIWEQTFWLKRIEANEFQSNCLPSAGKYVKFQRCFSKFDPKTWTHWTRWSKYLNKRWSFSSIGSQKFPSNSLTSPLHPLVNGVITVVVMMMVPQEKDHEWWLVVMVLLVVLKIMMVMTMLQVVSLERAQCTQLAESDSSLWRTPPLLYIPLQSTHVVTQSLYIST